MEQALLHGVCAGLIGFAFAHVMASKPGPWSFYFDAIDKLLALCDHALDVRGCVVHVSVLRCLGLEGRGR